MAFGSPPHMVFPSSIWADGVDGHGYLVHASHYSNTSMLWVLKCMAARRVS